MGKVLSRERWLVSDELWSKMESLSCQGSFGALMLFGAGYKWVRQPETKPG